MKKNIINKDINFKHEMPKLELIRKEKANFTDGNIKIMLYSAMIIKPQHSTSYFKITCAKGDDHYAYEGNKPTLVIAKNAIKLSLTGEWEIEHCPLAELITLIAFREAKFTALNNNELNSVAEGNGSLLFEHDDAFAIELQNNNISFMYVLFENNATVHRYAMNKLFNFIRKRESYWIVQFLLKQVVDIDRESDANKIYNACKEYGVSESYFRKLCYNIFSCGPKKKVRMWRAANSALQLIEGDDSISSVAWNNGYASSSHFSTEIKKIFGLTPKEFKKLEGYFNESLDS